MNQLVSRRTFLKSMGCGAISSLAIAGYGRTELQWLETHESEYILPRWQGKSIKVAYIADSHLTEQAAVATLQRAIRWILTQKPDIILFGGDFVEDIDSGVDNYMEPGFKGVLESGIPAFAVLGNHDYGSADPQRVIAKAEQLGFQVLRNGVANVDGITIVGLDCRSFGYTRPELLDKYKGTPNVICIVHEPDVVLEVSPNSCDLMLAGHSHGGQICLPGGIPIHTPLYAKVYKSGYFPYANNPLLVTRGLGATGIHIRTFCRPQAHILTISAPS